ncbi:unnamed protein product [Rotaria socialis]
MTKNIFVLNRNINDANSAFNTTLIITGSPSGVGVGRSVACINDRTVAINVFDVLNRSWSRPEVRIYDFYSGIGIRLFIFPNQQQTLAMRRSPLFLNIIYWPDQSSVLTDQSRMFVIRSAPPGFYSNITEDRSFSITISDQSYCLYGTFKNDFSAGPCFICPPQAKNSGNRPSNHCESCSSDVFCPMGSIDDTVTLNLYPSYTQTFPYRDTPDTNNYDNLLCCNHFCRMVGYDIDKKIGSDQIKHRHRMAKGCLKRIYIINEGEQWVDGLFSPSIIVAFVFAFWFAVQYVKLYPIEASSEFSSKCDSDLHNSLFDNAFQLPLPDSSGKLWPIFNMLRQQPITRTFDLVKIKADCPNISFKQNHAGARYIHISMSNCIIQPDNINQSVSVVLPQHEMALQMNVSGPYFIGACRLYLRGPGHKNNNSRLQTLHACQLFWTRNQTLSRSASLSVLWIKAVNQSKLLTIGELTQFDG